MEIDVHRWIADVQKLTYFRRRVAIARRVHPSPVRFFYKYRPLDETNAVSIDRLRQIVVESKLWLSSPKDFNDPFDMSGRIVANGTVQERLERIKTMLKTQGLSYKERERKRKSIMQMPVEEFKKILEASYTKHIENNGVCSFAGDPRSILMWSHYAKDHTGVCVQFEGARDFGLLSGALPVEYSSTYPEIDWIKDFQGSLEKVLLRKHEGWFYERESRIIRLGAARTFLRFDPEAVVGIILGCRSANAERGVVESLLEERKRAGMRPIRLLKARKHGSKYKLLIWAAK